MKGQGGQWNPLQRSSTETTAECKKLGTPPFYFLKWLLPIRSLRIWVKIKTKKRFFSGQCSPDFIFKIQVPYSHCPISPTSNASFGVEDIRLSGEKVHTILRANQHPFCSK